MGNYRCYVFLAFVFLWDLCSAISNSTQFEPIFVPEPRGRGTMGIFWSCVITLCLCVWTSVHPDVIPNPTTWRVTINKIIWMFIALLAPELIVGQAYEQKKQAKLVHNTWCAHFNIKPGSPEDKMGIEGAFFVVMGGFVVNEDPEAGEDSEKDNFTWHRSLTSKGFLNYLSKNQIPLDAINKRVIVDKGKADIVAKFLVCLQALWMVIQASARKASGLPITLLELHVVIQVMFVLITYTQWGYKPLNANEPIILSIEGEIGVTSARTFRKVGKNENSFLEILDSIEANWERSPSNGWVVIGAAVITGVAHASAWNYPFPTHIEKVMWRVSSIALAAPSMYISVSVVSETVRKVTRKYSRVDELDTGKGSWEDSTLCSILTVAFFLTSVPLYILSIIFITVEAFISLRKVP
ncbi:hypothetical protein P167DRAFT_528861, partial [Morchella conica CCBAS932]